MQRIPIANGGDDEEFICGVCGSRCEINIKPNFCPCCGAWAVK